MKNNANAATVVTVSTASSIPRRAHEDYGKYLDREELDNHWNHFQYSTQCFYYCNGNGI